MIGMPVAFPAQGSLKRDDVSQGLPREGLLETRGKRCGGRPSQQRSQGRR